MPPTDKLQCQGSEQKRVKTAGRYGEYEQANGFLGGRRKKQLVVVSNEGMIDKKGCFLKNRERKSDPVIEFK